MQMFVSIRHKIGLTLVSSVFVLTLAIVGAQQYHSYVRFRDYIQETSEITVRAAIDEVNKWVRSRLLEAKDLSLLAERSALSGKDLLWEVENFANKKHLESAFIGFESGQIFDSRGEVEEEASGFKKKSWYRQAAANKEAVFVPPDDAKKLSKTFFQFSAPIYDENRWIFQGAACIEADPDELKDAVNHLFLLPVKRLVLVKLPHNRTAILIQTQDMKTSHLKEIADRIVSDDWDDERTQTIAGEPYLVIREQIAAIKGPIVYPISLKKLLEPLIIQALFFFAITAAGLWFILALAWSVLGRLIHRIEKLNRGTRAVASGDFNAAVKDNSRDEIGQLAQSFDKMTVDLKTYMLNLENTTREKEAIARELEIAAQVQEDALPKEMPQIVGLQIAAKSFPAAAVGGDYYDFLLTQKDKIGFVIADAAGKGIPGTLYMSSSRSVFRIISTKETSPAEMLRQANEFITHETSHPKGMFITYIFGVYDVLTKKLTYSNAGHFPPLFYKAAQDSFESMDASGIPLGIYDHQEYPEETVDFLTGDILVLYTDGIIEAMNDRREMFGVESLKEIIRQNASSTAAEIIDTLAKKIAVFVGTTPQHDDMTIVVVKVRQP